MFECEYVCLCECVFVFVCLWVYVLLGLCMSTSVQFSVSGVYLCLPSVLFFGGCELMLFSEFKIGCVHTIYLDS